MSCAFNFEENIVQLQFFELTKRRQSQLSLKKHVCSIHFQQTQLCNFVDYYDCYVATFISSNNEK
jgi:hypothetical protein